MLTTLFPALREQHAALLSRFFNAREGFAPGERDAFDTPDTVYIVYENPDRGVVAGARINPLATSPVSFHYLSLFSQDQRPFIREVSEISFHMEEGHWAQEHPGLFDYEIQAFYRGLYDALVTLSVTQNLEGLVSLSREEDHPDLPFFGSWLFHRTHTLQTGEASYVIGELALLPDLTAAA